MVSTAKQPLLSVIMVAGPCRERAQAVLDQVCQQTARESIEIVIIDVSGNDVALSYPATMPVVYQWMPKPFTWGKARATGVRVARASAVAFIEDHCFPALDWAEQLIQAHQADWAAVGYSFRNANPDSYLSRAGMMIDYGHWQDLNQSGETSELPGNNVSYKRALLLELSEQLDTYLDIDYFIHQYLMNRGERLYVETRAIASHQNYTNLVGLLNSNYAYCRLFSANRIKIESFSLARRLFFSLVGIPVIPFLRLSRLLKILKKRPELQGEFLKALPILPIAYLWASTGEAIGYLLGHGHVRQIFHKFELEKIRTRF